MSGQTLPETPQPVTLAEVARALGSHRAKAWQIAVRCGNCAHIETRVAIGDVAPDLTDRELIDTVFDACPACGECEWEVLP